MEPTFPMEVGLGLELREENRGLKGLQGCDRDTLRCIHILATVNSAAMNIQLSHSVMSDCLQLHGMKHTRLPYLSPTPRACSNSYPSTWWYHPTISSSVIPFSSCLKSFPASESFPMSQFCVYSQDWDCRVIVIIQCLSCVQLFGTPWTAVCQAFLSFTREGQRSVAAAAQIHPPLRQLVNVLELFSCSVISNYSQPHVLQHARPPCRSPPPRACSNSCP